MRLPPNSGTDMIVLTARPHPWIAVFLLLGLVGGGAHLGRAQPTSKAASTPSPWAHDSIDRDVLPPDVDAHENAGINLPEASRRVVTLTNEERNAQDRAALTATPHLTRIACRHNKDMLAHSYSGHEDADGRRVGDRLSREHRTLLMTRYGENVFRARGHTPQNSELASLTVTSWMESPVHRKNILKRPYTHLGACVTQADDEIRATQVFATVVGRLAKRLPWSVSASDSLTTMVRAAIPNVQFRRYAFHRVGEREASDLDQTASFQGVLRLPSSPGRYGLRMAHVDAEGNPRSFQISFGPRITVQRP